MLEKITGTLRRAINSDLGAVAADFDSDEDAQRVLDHVVKHYGERPQGHVVGLDGRQEAARLLLGIGEDELLRRVDAHREEHRRQLRALASQAAAADERCESAKAAFLDAHQNCPDYKPTVVGLTTGRCATPCVRAHRAWRAEVERAVAPRGARAALLRLALPEVLRIGETQAREAVARATLELTAAADALEAAGRAPERDAARRARARAALEGRLAGARAALVQAAAEHEAAVAERQRLVAEALASLASPPAAEPKRPASRKAR